MSDEQIDYEDLTDMRLDDEALAQLLAAGGECVFNWTTKDGHPVGVVVAFVYHDGKFFTTCAERRKRVPALRKRPQSGIVINNAGKTATFKGESVVHAHGDEGFDELKRGSTPSCHESTSSPTTSTGRASTSSSTHRIG